MKPNTKQLDRMIQAAERKLAAVERRELWPLEGSERRAILVAGVAGGVKVTRGKSPGKANRVIEATWANAAARLRAEISAAETAKQKVIDEAAAAKVAKRAASRWW
jgi:hypothetical protein